MHSQRHTRAEIAAELSLSVGSVEKIIREHLKFCNVCQMGSETTEQ